MDLQKYMLQIALEELTCWDLTVFLRLTARHTGGLSLPTGLSSPSSYFVLTDNKGREKPHYSRVETWEKLHPFEICNFRPQTGKISSYQRKSAI